MGKDNALVVGATHHFDARRVHWSCHRGLMFPYSAQITRTIALWSAAFLEILLTWSFIFNWEPNSDLWAGRFPFVYLPLAITTVSLLVAAKGFPRQPDPSPPIQYPKFFPQPHSPDTTRS